MTRIGMCACAAIAAAAGTVMADVLPIRAVAIAKPTTGSGVHDTDAYGPNQGAGIFFAAGGSIFGREAIDNAGDIIFRGTQVNGATTTIGVWVNRWNGTSYYNTNIALGGAARPGGGNFGTTIFDNVLLHDASGSNPESLAFRNNTSSTGGVYSDVTGGMGTGLSRVMQNADIAPGTASAAYSAVSSAVAMNQNGQTAFASTLTGGDVVTTPVANGSGIWVGTPGSMNLAIRQGTTYNAIDPTGAVTVGSISTGPNCMSNAGLLTFVPVQGTGVTPSGTNANAQAILSTRTGSLEMIMRANNPAAGASAGELYGNPSTSMAINNAGNVAFSVSNLHNAAGTVTTPGTSLFSDIGGSMTVMARAGAAMPPVANSNPGEFSGATWSTSGSNFTDIVMNHSGMLAFKGSWNAATNAGILTMSPAGALTKVMKAGDVAPGVLDSNNNPGTFGASLDAGLQMNSVGQIVFSSTLAGTGIGSSTQNDHALFYFDPLNNNKLGLIARRGDMWEVTPGSGNFQKISVLTGEVTNSLGVSGGEDGRVGTLNDNGDFTFHLDFADGESGVYVVHIPAPGTCVLLGLGSIFASRRRRA
jgi:hypothetical protein